VSGGTFLTGYCQPTNTSSGDYISSFSTSGGTLNINNSGTGTAALEDFTAQTVSQFATGSVSFSGAYVGGSAGFSIWVDWNNNLVFDASEQMFNASATAASWTGSFVVPTGQALGNYRMRIRAQYNTLSPPACGAVGYGQAEDYTFTVIAAPACAQTPSGLTASATTSTTANISWTAASPAPGSGYQYAVTTSATPPASGTSTSSTSATVTSLSASTTYYLHVRSNCNGTDFSNWVTSTSFTTPCATNTTLPYTMGFDGSATCWTSTSGTAPWALANTSSADISAPQSGTGFAYKPYSTSTQYLFSPPFNFSSFGTSPIQLNVWIYRNSLTVSADNITFKVNTSASNTGATTLQSFPILTTSAPAVSTSGWYNYIVSLPTNWNSLGTIYFVIEGVTTAGFSSYEIGLDNFVVELAPACAQTPSGLTAAATTSTTANVSWTAASPTPGSGYEYAVTTSTTPPASGTTTTSTSASVTGLSASTTYYLHVRSNCNGTDFSNWVTSTSFTTPCVAASIPWTEGFESGYTNNSTIAGCFTQSSTTGSASWTANNSLTDYNRTPRTGSFNAFLQWSNEDWLYYPVQLTGGISYTFKVYARQDGATSSNSNITLAYGSSASSGSMTTITGPTGIINGDYQSISGTFTPASSGVYYMGIKGYMNGTPYYISLDDISVTTAPTVIPSCATYISPTNNESVVPSSGSVPVSWNAVTDADSYDVYKAGVFVANTTSTSYTLTGNTEGNTYSWYVVPKNVVGSAVGCSSSAISFTCISVPANDNPCGATALSISNSLTYTTYSNAGATATSGPPEPGCASYSTADVWFSVTVPASGIINFDSQTGTITDGGMAIYSGTCSSLTLVECDDDDSPNGAMPYISLTGRTPGETLWIRMWDYYDGTGTFGLCVRSQAADLTSATLSQNNVCPGTSVTLTANGVDGTAYWYTTCGTSGELGTGNTLNVSPSATTTYYARNYRYGNFSTNCASVTVTVTQPSTSIMVNNSSISNGDYLWNGNTSSDGSVASNWYIFNGSNYSVATNPPTTQNVYMVSNTTATNCVSSSNSPSNPAASAFAASNVYIGSGATLTQANGSTFNVSGNFTNNGTFTPGTGTVNMNGSTAQSIGGSAATTFNNLTINNASGVALENSANVDGSLTLTNGRLSLGSNNLTLGTSATISGSPSASNMIVAASTGELRKRFSSAVSNQPAFTFPVGTVAGGNEYTPVVLDFNSGTFGASAYVSVKLEDSKNSSMNNVVANYINRNWIVEPSNITNYNYEIKLYYTDADVVTTNLPEGSIKPVKNSSGQWYQPDDLEATFVNAVKQGSGFIYPNSNYMVWGGLVSFSEFGGAGGDNVPLPVELVSFSGACEDGVISLTWQTASEHNSSHFDVEKSRDGENWQLLSTLPSAGTSNELITYQSSDQNGLEGNNYFRLRQVDVDGKEKLYDPINVSCSEVTTGYFSSFPNPSGSAFQVVVNNKELLGNCTLNMVDASGKVIEQREIEVKDGINMFVINQELNPGIYFLNISNGSKSTPVIRHAIK
jgi:hypothetical protein